MNDEIVIDGVKYVKEKDTGEKKVFGNTDRKFIVYSDGSIDCCDEHSKSKVQIQASLDSLYEAVELSKKRRKEEKTIAKDE